jgi:hypothetical protein
MMKKILLPVALISVLILIMACSLFSPANRELDRNRTRWQEKNIQDYRFALDIGCMCPWYEQMPLTIEVRNGEVASITAANGEDISSYLETYNKHDTIDELFDTIKFAIQNGADEIKVYYDPDYGFPTSILINPMKNAFDDETGYTISDFEVLK